MFILRLFHRDNPFEQIDARVLAEGKMRLGRDADADWCLSDPEGTLSRTHCWVEVKGGKLWLKDESRNGTFLDSGERASAEIPLMLDPGQTIRLGALRILIDTPGDDLPGGGDLTMTAPFTVTAPRTWTDDDGAAPAPYAQSLLDAFCEGARLDPSALCAEDAEDVMRRAGAIYQQAVLGLSALVAQRAAMKDDYDLERTTIGAAENNPFKWAPTRQLGHNLLCKAEPGFLPDAEAVRATFQDLAQHMTALSEGAGAAAQTVLTALAPEEIDAEARAESSLLRSRAATCWDIHNRRYRALTGTGGAAGPALRTGFQAGYDRTSASARR